MLPLSVITAPVPPLPTLVATPLPAATGSLRALPTDVAPSFSDEQVNNNSKGGNPTIARVISNTISTETQNTIQNSSAANNSPVPALSSQASFLAQLISQDSSPQTQVLLVQYEKLVAFSNVKYKPSNAGKPQPVGLFEQLVRGNAIKKDEPALSVERAPVALPDETPIAAAQPVPRDKTDNQDTPILSTEGTDIPLKPAESPAVQAATLRAIHAYSATNLRNNVAAQGDHINAA